MSGLDNMPIPLRVFIGGCVVVFAAGAFVLNPRAESLSCIREAPASYVCTHAHTYYVRQPDAQELRLTGPEQLEFREYEAGKSNKPKGATLLLDSDDSPVQVFADERESARNRHQQLHEFLAGDGDDGLVLEREAGLWPPIGLAGLCCIGVFLVVSALRGRHRAGA